MAPGSPPSESPEFSGHEIFSGVREDWDLPLFSSREGGALVHRILGWAGPKEG